MASLAMQWQIHWVERSDYRLAVSMAEGPGNGDLLLLHGAGVASEATWYPMSTAFSQYRRVLCVDLRGMGRSHALDYQDRPLIRDVLCDDIEAVARAFGLQCVDLVGYSFGGMLALLWRQRSPNRVRRLCLIEPALLERSDLDALRDLRAAYRRVAERLLEDADPAAGVLQFLDLVSPNRSRHPRVERLTVQRLAARPKGLAYALMAVDDASWTVDRAQLSDFTTPALSLVGSKTPAPAHQLHQQLASERVHWQYRSVAGVDHAAPYQKPLVIASLCAEFFAT